MKTTQRPLLPILAAFYAAWVLLSPLAPAAGEVAGNWPAWRGDGSGISAEKNLPVLWDAGTNIAWKTPIPGQGNSSPVVWGDRVFVTSSTEGGKKRHVICIDARTGRLRWQKTLDADRIAKTYAKNGYASATPATDGKVVYAFFDSPGLVAIDAGGKKVLWTRDLGPFKTPWNLAASPVLCGDLVIVACDHDGKSFLAGVDRAGGTVRWKVPRDTSRMFATPLVVTAGKDKQIVVNGPTVMAYRPADGATVWSCRGMKNMLTPSAVFDGSLVYVTSGRNGPSMAIDPRGAGDVSRTHVRMYLPSGGPYVPSPLVYPYLFLPADNGAARFVDPRGRVVAKRRLRGHFSSSPVAAEGRIYWCSEKGDTYVLDTSGLKAGRGAVKVLAVNRLGEKVIASPAIAGGRIYVRTEKHLYCIAGSGKPAATPPPAAPSRSFAKLLKLYETRQESEGDDVAVRLGVVEDLARLKTAPAIDLLKRIAQKDKHWDVSEEAVKALGAYGEPAAGALVELLGAPDWQEYLKVVSAGHLGRLKWAPAVGKLLDLTGSRDPLVRTAAIEALGLIAAAHPDQAPKVVARLAASLDDRASVVQRGAVEALARLAGKLGDRRERVVARLLDLAADKDKIVAAPARRALVDSLKVKPEIIMKDEILYGEQRKEPLIERLRAGPVSLKFQDGELRYLHVGDREIVRRVYFAVRDKRWDTVMPVFSNVRIRKKAGSFQIQMKAACKNDVADYSWTGKIVGDEAGKITFSVSGRAGMDFTSWRIGLCVLFGAESLAGLDFETVDGKGAAAKGVFPRLVSRTHPASNFRTLRYTSPEGVQVAAGLADGLFSMEDQRNFGDSSYKAFSGIAYRYPKVARGPKGEQTFVLEVKGAKPGAKRRPLSAITIGGLIDGAIIPKLGAPQDPAAGKGFMHYLGKRDDYESAERITMPYKPSAHMPDDDMYMENAPAIADQVRTLRSIASKASFRIDPITLDSPYPRPGRDPRNRGLFAAAWCARVVKYLAIAGVDEAAFDVGPAYAALALKAMAPYAGQKLLAVDVGPHEAIDVLAIGGAAGRTIWVVNKTADKQTAVIKPFADSAKLTVRRIDAATPLKSGIAGPQKLTPRGGALKLELGPFEVCIIAEGR